MQYEPTSQMYHTFGRWYSPWMERRISEDPKSFSGGDTNLYGYVREDPVNSLDPMGMGGDDCPLGDCAGGGTGGVGSAGSPGTVAEDPFNIANDVQFLVCLFGGCGGDSGPVLYIARLNKARFMMNAQAIGLIPSQLVANPQPTAVNTYLVSFVVPLPPGTDPDLGGIFPVPLEAGPLLCMAADELGSRAARRAEQRLVRLLMRKLGIADRPELWDWLHDELHELKRSGITSYDSILEYLKEHIPND